jgi:hypothetical protein
MTARSVRVTVTWEHDGEDFRVVGSYTPGTPDRGPDFNCAGGYPGDPAEFEILEVREDAPGGALRPDLLAAAEADFQRLADRAAQDAQDDEPDADRDDAGEVRP